MTDAGGKEIASKQREAKHKMYKYESNVCIDDYSCVLKRRRLIALRRSRAL